MNKKISGSLAPLLLTILILLTLNTVALFFFSKPAFYISLSLTLSAWLLTLLYLRKEQQRTYTFLKQLAESLESAGSHVLTEFSLPVVITRPGKADSIVWYNDAFRSGVLHGRDAFGLSAHFLLNEDARAALAATGTTNLQYEMRHYAVFRSVSKIENTEYAIYYFVDETKLRRTATEYSESRPSAAYIAIDNLEELVAGSRESEKAQLLGQIEKKIENFVTCVSGISTKTAGGRFLVLMEERHLRRVMEEKFDILNQVRSIVFEDKGSPTLSIGVGRGADLHDSEELARSALDMALGRGGDQAAIKSQNGDFQFFGGVSRGVERRTRVRSRVVAQAVRELVEGSDNVLIMGHRYADLDSFGAATGLYAACMRLDKPARIVMNRETSMALPLLQYLESNGFQGFVCGPEDVLPFITKKTLLIVVDTHRGDFVDSREVYEACETVVVIDHHRKTVNYIDNAVIFFHEPSSSSTCEMVAELIQYMGENLLSHFEAEAMMAGIMLDTRNFVLRTGIRTFEAAAYLRSRGADPVRVKTLFSGSMDAYRERAAIVACAEIYHRCAISLTDSDFPQIRIATSQAADELLTISGVDASFVIFQSDDTVQISARSMGLINVQVIMEALGGGGHQTMAAAQLPGETLDSAKVLLMSAIEQSLSS